MSIAKHSRPGVRRFHWNSGGWFGSVVGSTAWMMVTAGFLLANRQLLLAMVPIGCFLSTNMIGWLLWSRRDRLDPFSSLMAVLSVIAVTVPVAWTATAHWGSPLVLAQMNWPTSPIWNAVVVLVVPAGMAWFCIIESVNYCSSAQRRTTRRPPASHRM